MKMRIDIVTLFPEVFRYFDISIIKKAKLKNIVNINIHNIRDFSEDKHRKVDDRPYGGGPGMVLQLQPIYKCLKFLAVYPNKSSKTKIILTKPGGVLWNQNFAKDFACNVERLVLICGHYQGVDNRVSEYFVDLEVSIGEYVLTGGEIPAMVIVDSIVRLIPGVLGNHLSTNKETYTDDIKYNYPLYTRPSVFTTEEGYTLSVPKILTEGNHKEIEKWKQQNINL